jgi:hypothetical protein
MRHGTVRTEFREASRSPFLPYPPSVRDDGVDRATDTPMVRTVRFTCDRERRCATRETVACRKLNLCQECLMERVENVCLLKRSSIRVCRAARAGGSALLVGDDAGVVPCGRRRGIAGDDPGPSPEGGDRADSRRERRPWQRRQSSPASGRGNAACGSKSRIPYIGSPGFPVCFKPAKRHIV